MQHNCAMLAKWWLRFKKEKTSLWVKVIEGKYNIGGNQWLPTLPQNSRASNIWKDMCKVGDDNSIFESMINQGFKVSQG